MPRSTEFKALVRDALIYARDPLFPSKTLLATREECALFKSQAVARRAPPVHKPLQYAPAKPPAPLEPQVVEIPSEPYVAKPLPPKPEPQRTVDFSHIQKIVQQVAPALKLSEEIPSDVQATKIANSWKEKLTDVEVVLLAIETDAETLELLKNLAKAIDQHLAKAKIVPAERLEQEKQWDVFLQTNRLKLLIVSDGMHKCPELERACSAGLPPLLQLSSAAHYKILEHKALLWKTVCQRLKK